MSLYGIGISLRVLALLLLVAGLPARGLALPRPLADGIGGGAVKALPAIALAMDGEAYLVGEFDPGYAEPHPDHPPLGPLHTAEIALGKVADGYIAPREGVPIVHTTLEQIAGEEPEFYYASAIATINLQILKHLNQQGLGAVLVQTHPADIDPVSGEDKRIPVVQETVRVEIQTGRIGDLRVVEIEGFGFGDVAPNEVERIKAGSPIQPAGGPEGTTDLLRTDLLKDYVAELNRHPGRRVVAEISPSRITPGVAYLDYKVVEEKAWSVYAQKSDTGTEETNRWRNRFGFRNTQLTGRDDILRLDYVTGGTFSDMHALFGSYEAPVPGVDKLRFQVNGVFGDYDASEVGFSQASFEGRQHQLGGELIANVYQYEDLFVDFIAGVQWKDSRVKNKLPAPPGTDNEGHEDYFAPKAGIRVVRNTDAASFSGAFSWERSLGGGSSLRLNELELLGRPNGIDKRWQILRWESSLSAFLEPVLARVFGAVDPGARVHELFLSFRGQSALGNRLIPQEEMIAGGLYTVRGYPQAAIAADTVYLMRAEYLLHVPRLFAVQPKPLQVPVLGDFRIARQHARGRPDWDLKLSLFADQAVVRQSDIHPGENDATLLGFGAGAELQIRRNVSILYNLGWAQRDLREVGGGSIAESGDVEHHLSFTVLY